MACIEPGHYNDLVNVENEIPETVNHLSLGWELFENYINVGELLSERFRIIGITLHMVDMLCRSIAIAFIYQELNNCLSVLGELWFGKVFVDTIAGRCLCVEINNNLLVDSVAELKLWVV